MRLVCYFHYLTIFYHCLITNQSIFAVLTFSYKL